MRFRIALVALLFAFSLSTAPLSGQGRGKGQAKKPTVGATQGAKTDRVKPAKVAKAPKAEKAAKTTKVAKPTTTDARVKGNKHKAPALTTNTSTPISEVTPTTPTTAHVKNPKLEARLLDMLGGNMTIHEASSDFKNWGQFVAAVHASKRLNIPFADLKAKMTGITPATTPGGLPVTTAPMSLGQAVKSLTGTTTTTTPDGTTMTQTQIQTEVKKAEDAATADLRRTRVRS